jgi:hypothetical protein
MKVTVADAAKKLGMSAQGLRIALQRGRFSQFGVAWKNEQKWSYYINRARLEQYLKAEGVNDELYIKPQED